MKIFLVGRHQPDFGDADIEVVAQENVTFPARAAECQEVLWNLGNQARNIGMDVNVVLQNAPAQVAAALVQLDDFPTANIGIVVNKPAARLAGVERVIDLTEVGCSWIAEEMADAVAFANPRAAIAVVGATVTVTVDPPMRFEFSHIEWIWNGGNNE